MNFDNILGIVCIIFGFFIIGYALGELVFRLLIALIGLLVINFGMRLRGMPPIHIAIIRMWSNRYNF